MSAPAPSRLMLRHTRFIARQTNRRHASTTEATKDAAAKSRETASNATSKASQGLSRVTSSAGPALSGAAQRVTSILGRIGGRTGRLISFAECEWIFEELVQYTLRVDRVEKKAPLLLSQLHACTAKGAAPSRILQTVSLKIWANLMSLQL